MPPLKNVPPKAVSAAPSTRPRAQQDRISGSPVLGNSTKPNGSFITMPMTEPRSHGPSRLQQRVLVTKRLELHPGSIKRTDCSGPGLLRKTSSRVVQTTSETLEVLWLGVLIRTRTELRVDLIWPLFQSAWGHPVLVVVMRVLLQPRPPLLLPIQPLRPRPRPLLRDTKLLQLFTSTLHTLCI